MSDEPVDDWTADQIRTYATPENPGEHKSYFIGAVKWKERVARMVERDRLLLATATAEIATLRSHLETATAENERLEALFQQSHGCHSSWVAKGVKLAATLETARRALEAIGRTFEDDIGPRCNVCRRPMELCDTEPVNQMFHCAGRIARAALRAFDTPAATPAQGVCAEWCGKTNDSANTHDSPAWWSDARRLWFCEPACRDAGAPRSPSRSSK